MLLRPMPISSIDFVVLTTAMDIIPVYLSVFEIILCAIGIIALIIGAVLAIRKSKRHNRNFKFALIPFIIATLTLTVFLIGGNLTDRLDIDRSDITKTYNDNGFIYSFSSSLFDRGINKPERYSNKSLEAIIKKYDINEGNVKTPNIIVIQLESFFDVSKYKKYMLINDPIPNFHKIAKKHGSAGLLVPSNGGGTVNTEFEILTGMNLEYFGTGEYPYTTILKKTTCESAPYILKSYGYTSHAIHNHTGVFYGRNEVYPNLGFDTFTPIEYMQYEENELGWAKDIYLFDEIKDAIESTDNKDFVFAVSVEGHGLYKKEDRENNPFKIQGRENISEANKASAYMYEFYCGLLNETDKFVGKLYDYVMSLEEETVVIIYGDHLPSLAFSKEEYSYKSDYVTDFTVFANFEDFSFNYDKEIYPANILISEVFEALSINDGIINRINRKYNTEKYEEDLKEIQYDILYGDKYSLKYKKYERAEMIMGVNIPEITDVVYSNGLLTLKGKNFTKDSIVFINGWQRDTEFVDSQTLRCTNFGLSKDDNVSIRQIAVNGKALSEVFYN